MNDGDGKIVGGGGIGMVSWKCVIGNKMIGAVWGACFVNSALEVKVAGTWVGAWVSGGQFSCFPCKSSHFAKIHF